MMQQYRKERDQERVQSALNSDGGADRMDMMTLWKMVYGDIVEVGEMYIPWKLPVAKRRAYIVRELERRSASG